MPVVDAKVSAHDYNSGSSFYDATTDARGTYTIIGLPAGRFRVSVTPPQGSGLLGEFYQDSPNSGQATVLYIEEDISASGINFALVPGGNITGRVTDARGVPLPGIRVIADMDGYGYGWTSEGYANTDENGSYSIRNLSPGSYQLRVLGGSMPDGRYLMGEYYEGAYENGSAQLVEVANGETTSGISFSLEEGGEISGLVTDEFGDPIPWATVFVRDYSHGYAGSASTDENGIYEIIGLFTGAYTVEVYPSPLFEGEFYEGAETGEEASPVDVMLGHLTSGIDFLLAEKGNWITGNVTDSSGTPVEGAAICVISTQGEWTAYSENWTVYSDADGSYRLRGLAAGRYLVRATPPGGSGLIWEYHGGTREYGAALTIAVTEGGTTAGIDFSLDMGGTITGRVTDESGAALPGFMVYAYGDSGRFTGRGYTDSAGYYSIAGLPPADYVVSTNYGTNYTQYDYIFEYYNNTRDYSAASPVTVAGYGTTTRGIDFVLTGYGKVTGIIKDKSGRLVTNANVYAFAYDDPPYFSSYSGSLGRTDANGRYTIKGLPTGDYRIQAYPDYDTSPLLSCYYGGTIDWTTASPVHATEGRTTYRIDITLIPYARISGTVRDEAGNPVANADVYANPTSEGTGNYGSSTTASDGTYSISHLSPVSYVISAFPPYESGLAQGYHPNARDLSSATPVYLTEGGKVTGIDISLSSYGKITGTVRSVAGTSVSWVYVYAYDVSTGNTSNWTTASPSGVYTLSSLPAGKYIIYAQPTNGSGCLSAYYRNASDRISAIPVEVTFGKTTTGIDFALPFRGGVITGRVTDESGEPISGVSIRASGSTQGTLPGYGYSDAQGFYALTNLKTGSYRVYTEDSYEGSNGFINEYYNDTRDAASATTVQVTEGNATAGIDFVLTEGGKISGLVTGESGEPIPWAYVYAYDLTTGQILSKSRTRADGVYTLIGLLTGNYDIYVASPSEPQYNDYIPEYYNDSRTHESSTPVSVRERGTASDIDFTIAQYGKITGVIRDQGGKPVPRISVYANDIENGGWYGQSGYSDENGVYIIKTLRTGTYRVYCSTPSDEFVGGYHYYNNTSEMESATPVTVKEGAVASGIDFSLIRCGSISGILKDSTGAPLSNVSIKAYAYVTGLEARQTWSNYNGTYTISGLAPGTYAVGIDSPLGSAYLDIYFNDAHSLDEATQVLVASGVTTTGVDLIRTKGGVITGVVADEDGSPIPWANVYAFDYATGEELGSTLTGSDGSYSIIGLVTGSYLILANAYDYRLLTEVSETGFIGEFYDDAPDDTSASPVQAMEEGMTQNIDFSLVKGGKISGVVKGGLDFTVKDAQICALDYQTDAIMGITYSGERGYYEIVGLPAGTYRLQITFTMNGRSDSSFYVGTEEHDEALPVVVAKGETTPGIDFDVEHGWITGSVFDQFGNPVEGVSVTAREHSFDPWSCYAMTDVNGVFKLAILFDALYDVYASYSSYTEYAWTYYDNTQDEAAITPVHASKAESATGIDFTFTLMDTDSDGVMDHADDSPYDPEAWSAPGKPSIMEPVDGSGETVLAPVLKSSAFTDADSGTHSESIWEIYSGEGVAVMLISSPRSLVSFKVPPLVLEPGTKYYARVCYTDNQGMYSPWSEPVSFTTTASEDRDANGDGVPDDQEIEGETDLDGNGVNDAEEPGMKRLLTLVGSTIMGVKLSDDWLSLISLESVDPVTITDGVNRPSQIPTGLIAFKILAEYPGAEAHVVIYLANPAAPDAKWYSHDEQNGWREYPYAEFSADRKSVTLTLADGNTEYGDIDGVANGIIVDPSGIASMTAITPEETGGGGGGGGGCFISSSGSDEREVFVHLLLSLVAALWSTRMIKAAFNK